jgi:hypothetical protein
MIKDIVRGIKREDLPKSINELLDIIFKFTINKDYLKNNEAVFEENKNKFKPLSIGMNPKKMHEVYNMASIISKVSQQTSSNYCADIGSGIGEMFIKKIYCYQIYCYYQIFLV